MHPAGCRILSRSMAGETINKPNGPGRESPDGPQAPWPGGPPGHGTAPVA